MLTYDRLTIRIEPSGEPGQYEVVAQGDSGEAHGTFAIPFEPRDVENFVLRMSRGRRATRRIETSDAVQAKDFGRRLFTALFQGDVRDVYRSSLADARHGDRGMRVTLALTKAPELMDLPWEFLFDDPDFLSASVWTPVVRYLDVARPAAPLAVPPPLRILGMISRADDLPELDVDGERRRLESALRPLRRTGRVELHWTQEASLDSLLRKLRAGDFHIFHFVGHGAYDEARDDGLLLLQGEDGRAQEVTGERLSRILNDHHPMRLAVLNACEGARSSNTDPFAGVAASLVQRGLPAVVAMQFEITDAAAVTFAEHFYSAISLGFPVDAATAQARQGIYASGNDVEWGTPVLFLRPPDGRIFDVRWEDVRSEGPSLSASVEAHPAEASAGAPITWSLYVQNTGRPSLFGVAPRASGGVPAREPTELLSGETAVFTWEGEADSGPLTVTVEASTADGTEVRTSATGRHDLVAPEGDLPPEDEPEQEPEPKLKPERAPDPKLEPEISPPPPPPPPPPPQQVKRRPDRQRLSIAAGALVLAIVVAIAIASSGGGGPDDTGAEPGGDQTTVKLDAAPNAMTVEHGIVWASTRAGAVGITPSGGKVTRGMAATKYGRTVVGDDESLWVPIPTSAKVVVQLSSRTGAEKQPSIHTEGTPKAVTLSGGDVYVSQTNDARTSTWVQAYGSEDARPTGPKIPVPPGTQRLLVRDGALWVISWDPGVDHLYRYDLATPGPPRDVAVGDGATAIIYDDTRRAFWITLYDSGALARVDAKSMRPTRFDVGGTPANLRLDGNDLWVTNTDRQSLQRVNAESGAVTDTVSAPPHPYSLAIVDEGIWVGDTGEDFVRLVKF